jgi:hypothetical protein
MSEKNEITFTCNLMGGLGNQMFQIAHTYAQSKRYGVKCVFYPYSETNLQGNNTNFYINNIFSKSNFNNKRPDSHVIFESSFSFNKIDLPKDKNILFSGYFQSHKNFYGYDKEIQKLFEPPKEFIQKITQNTEGDAIDSLICCLSSFRSISELDSNIMKKINQKEGYIF